MKARFRCSLNKMGCAQVHIKAPPSYSLRLSWKLLIVSAGDKIALSLSLSTPEYKYII